ncbi:MAG: extracellular solute-binding protein [Chloroflexota bacterium]|nr:extracellular solute-binding protein [Chloroflexota bacterium]
MIPKPSKRVVQIGLLSLILILIVSACVAAPAPAPESAVVESEEAVVEPEEAAVEPEEAEPSHLRVGIYAYMTKGIPFDEVVALYEQAHPEVEIEVLPIPGEVAAWQPLTQKMQLEAQQGKAPWDIIIGPTPFVEPGTLASLGLLEPLDDLLPQELFDDMYSGVREEIKFTGDGKSYLLPWWSDVFGLIYRPSMLKEAVGTEEPPQTWEELLAYCEKIEAHYGDEIACIGGDWSWSHRLFLPMLGTMTENVFVEPGIFNLEGDGAVQTLELMQQLYPYMPATAIESLGSSKAFQAGGVAMELYWQTQHLRALQAGVPEDDLKIGSFPKGDFVNTIFWSGGAVIPTHSENKEEAVRFMLEGLLGDTAVRSSYLDNYKIVPYRSISEKFAEEGVLPEWAPSLLEPLDVAQPIPSNSYFLTIEQPAFQEELEKMMLDGQSPEDTVANLKQRIEEGVAEAN